MQPIRDMEDIEKCENIFGNLWKSAVITVSLIEVEDDLRVPNGEVVFKREALEEKEEKLYEVKNFSIIRKTINEPFELLKDMYRGKLIIEGKDVEPELDMPKSPQGFFSVGMPESSIFEEKPEAELNRSFTVKIPEESEFNPGDYKQARKEFGGGIKYSNKPFFSISACESYYFENYFVRGSKTPPRIMLFADPKLDFEITEQNELNLKLPEELTDKVSFYFYPNRPYGEHHGREIKLEDRYMKKVENDFYKFRKKLDLNNIKQFFLELVGEDLVIISRRVRNRELEEENERYKIFRKYDQKERLKDFLTEGSSIFEVAVLNLLGIAGYRTQWFGNNDFSIPNYDEDMKGVKFSEIDIVAYSPDNENILFVECANARISNKSDLVDRVKRVTSEAEIDESIIENRLGVTPKKVVPCVATPQSIEEISDSIQKDFREKGILVLTREDLLGILEKSVDEQEYLDISQFKSLGDSQLKG